MTCKIFCGVRVALIPYTWNYLMLAAVVWLWRQGPAKDQLALMGANDG